MGFFTREVLGVGKKIMFCQPLTLPWALLLPPGLCLAPIPGLFPNQEGLCLWRRSRSRDVCTPAPSSHWHTSELQRANTPRRQRRVPTRFPPPCFWALRSYLQQLCLKPGPGGLSFGVLHVQAQAAAGRYRWGKQKSLNSWGKHEKRVLSLHRGFFRSHLLRAFCWERYLAEVLLGM